mgnify:CR=1 FL=1
MLIVKTSLSWDKVKGICVIADEHIVKGTQVSQFHSDWDKVYRKDYIEMLKEEWGKVHIYKGLGCLVLEIQSLCHFLH